MLKWRINFLLILSARQRDGHEAVRTAVLLVAIAGVESCFNHNGNAESRDRIVVVVGGRGLLLCPVADGG